jgi:hypothetical protein
VAASTDSVSIAPPGPAARTMTLIVAGRDGVVLTRTQLVHRSGDASSS